MSSDDRGNQICRMVVRTADPSKAVIAFDLPNKEIKRNGIYSKVRTVTSNPKIKFIKRSGHSRQVSLGPCEAPACERCGRWRRHHCFE